MDPHGDYKFQLTSDPDAPTVELVKVVKNARYHLPSIELAIEHAKTNPEPAVHLQIMLSTNDGQNRHRLFPKCIPLDDQWTNFTTKHCAPQYAQMVLTKANTTYAGFAQYPAGTPHSEYVMDVMADATWHAYDSLYPDNGQLGRFLSQTIRETNQQRLEPPKQPVNIISTEGRIARIAYPAEKPHIAIPTSLLAELKQTLETQLLSQEDKLHQMVHLARRIISLKPPSYQQPTAELLA